MFDYFNIAWFSSSKSVLIMISQSHRIYFLYGSSNFFQSTHNPTKGVCPICLLVTDGSTLARHLKKKHFLKHHLCTVCGKEFDMLLKMQVHMSTAHAEVTGSSRIVCEQVRNITTYNMIYFFISCNRVGRYGCFLPCIKLIA